MTGSFLSPLLSVHLLLASLATLQTGETTSAPDATITTQYLSPHIAYSRCGEVQGGKKQRATSDPTDTAYDCVHLAKGSKQLTGALAFEGSEMMCSPTPHANGVRARC